MGFYDFNDAGEQFEGGSFSPIPGGSVVLVAVRPEYINEGKEESDWIHRAKTGTAQLKVNFEVVDGQFAGRKWNEFWTMDEAKAKAAQITRAKIKALLESARGIDPKDMSDNACAARKIAGPWDLYDLQAWAEITYRLNEHQGETRVYNEVKKFVTPGMEHYGAEFIGSEPIPEAKPKAAAPAWGAKPAASGAAPAWGNKAPAASAPAATAKPAWAK